MDKKLELLLRAICAYEVNGIANFALKNLNFFGSENTIRRNIEKLENLTTEDGEPYIIKINLNGYYSRFKINKILDCPKFIYNNSFSVMYKVILLSLYDIKEDIPEVLTISGLSKLLKMSYNTIKKYFNDNIKQDLYDGISLIKLNLNENLEDSEYGLKYTGARKNYFKCECCGEENPDEFYNHNHNTCKKCLYERSKNKSKVDMATKLYRNSKQSYRSRLNLEGYDLTKKYIQNLLNIQNYKCYYTGVDLEIGDKLKNPTIDRIDSSKGYIEGNIVICTEIANVMKNDLTTNEFKNQIKLLYNNINNF